MVYEKHTIYTRITYSQRFSFPRDSRDTSGLAAKKYRCP